MNPICTSRWAALVLVAAIAGCDDAPAPAPSPAPAPAAKPGETKPSETKPGETKPPETKSADAKPADAKPGKPLDIAAAKLTDEDIANINKLPSEADRKLALEQKLCPDSGDHLGSMEVPIKITLKGQTVFLCCGGCKKGAEANPEATLAKLGK